MSTFRLDLSVQETEQVANVDDNVPAVIPTEQRSLVLVFTDDETVMAAALRAAADMLDPTEPQAARKRLAERAERRGRRLTTPPAEEGEEFL